MIILQKLNALQLLFVVRIHLLSDIYKQWNKCVWTKKTPMTIKLNVYNICCNFKSHILIRNQNFPGKQIE